MASAQKAAARRLRDTPPPPAATAACVWVRGACAPRAASPARPPRDCGRRLAAQLEGLYDRVAAGGYIYVDDYGSFNGCREAVDAFRQSRRIYEPMHFIPERDGAQVVFEAVWWQKEGGGAHLHNAAHAHKELDLPQGAPA